jgi:hypothetical protein
MSYTYNTAPSAAANGPVSMSEGYYNTRDLLQDRSRTRGSCLVRPASAAPLRHI